MQNYEHIKLMPHTQVDHETSKLSKWYEVKRKRHEIIYIINFDQTFLSIIFPKMLL